MLKESAATSAGVHTAAGAKENMVTGAKVSTSGSRKQAPHDIQRKQDEGSSSDYPKVEIKRLGYIFYTFANLKFNREKVQIFHI